MRNGILVVDQTVGRTGYTGDMAPGWLLVCLVVPPAAATAAWFLARGRELDPGVIVLLNGLMPGSGLAAADRPVVEIVLGVLFAQVSGLIARGPDPAMLAPVGVIAAGWALLYTPWNPLKAQGLPAERAVAHDPSVPPPPPPPRDTVGGMAKLASKTPGDEESDVGEGYTVSVRCTECGADVAVPVLHRAARCSFCGSHHLVTGHGDILQLAIPPKINDSDTLREAVLDHLRYRHYLKLYERFVAPLERKATTAAPQGSMIVSPDVEAASAAAEQAISAKADAFRSKVAKTLKIDDSTLFFAPYHHSMGTLYQAAFGRDRRTEDKRLLFTMSWLEAAAAAQETVELPPMGKLSYLKTLIAAGTLGAEAQALPLNVSADALEHAYGHLDRKQLDRSIKTIRLGSSFNEEIRAVVWRPWWIVTFQTEGREETLLVDGASGSVSGAAPFVDADALDLLPDEARGQGETLRFQPMECPTCGDEFPYDTDAVLHFCNNCHRLFSAGPGGKKETPYDYGIEPITETYDLVPFWRFPLHLKTGDGQIITDLAYLRDAIDGRLDQLGDDAVQGQDFIWIPAVRCINSRLMARAFNDLLTHVLLNPPKIRRGRFDLDEKPHPWPICLEEWEVRRFAPLYLANAFGRRDIARVNIHQVETWLFRSELLAAGRVTYLPIPRAVTEPFRAYVGRYRGRALAAARGN